MPFDVLRASITGTMPGGEVWSVNPIYAFGDFGQPTPTFAAMQAAVTAVNAIVPGTDLRSQMSTLVSITGSRLECRKLDGSLEIIAEGPRASASAGTSVASCPPQTAVVTSLRSATPGARGRGRLYWPTMAPAMSSSTGRWAAGNRDSHLAAVKAYLASIGTALGTALSLSGVGLVVWSRTSQAAYPVISLMAGDVIDTQRRRRDALPESYTLLPYP